jgi:hypothetical protein
VVCDIGAMSQQSNRKHTDSSGMWAMNAVNLIKWYMQGILQELKEWKHTQ